MTHPVIDALRQQLRAHPVTGLELEPEDMRARLDAMIAVMPPPPPDLRIEAGEVGGVDGRWIGVEGAEPERTILYLHGGAYVIGTAETHREVACRLARAAEARVFSANYRLAPEHPYPAALDDAVAAFRGLVEAGTPAEQIAIAGDSAGGGLAICAALALRDAGGPQPAAIVAISPWVDLRCEGDSFAGADDPVVVQAELQRFARLYAGERDLGDPLLSPVCAELAGLPPLLLHIGGDEALRSDCEAFAAKAEAEGVDIESVVWNQMIHAWHYYAAILDEGAEAIAAIAAFLAKRC